MSDETPDDGGVIAHEPEHQADETETGAGGVDQADATADDPPHEPEPDTRSPFEIAIDDAENLILELLGESDQTRPDVDRADVVRALIDAAEDYLRATADLQTSAGRTTADPGADSAAAGAGASSESPAAQEAPAPDGSPPASDETAAPTALPVEADGSIVDVSQPPGATSVDTTALPDEAAAVTA